MVWSMHRWCGLRRAAVRGALLAGLGVLAIGMTAPAAMAQSPGQTTTAKQKSPAPAPAAPAAPAAPEAGGAGSQAGNLPGTDATPADQEQQSAWVKLCEKSEQTENKEICLTHHERLDGNSGMVLVAAAVRKIEGEDKQQLLVRLPTAIALAIPAGVQIRVDDKEPVALKYTLCYGTSCQAETEMTKELFDSMRNGKQMVVAAVNLQRKAIGFPVPLAGFGKAYDGPPVDNAKYQAARQQLMEAIRKRQIELANKAAEAEQQKKDQAGQPGQTSQAQATGSTAPAPSGTTAAKKAPSPQ